MLKRRDVTYEEVKKVTSMLLLTLLDTKRRKALGGDDGEHPFSNLCLWIALPKTQAALLRCQVPYVLQRSHRKVWDPRVPPDRES